MNCRSPLTSQSIEHKRKSFGEWCAEEESSINSQRNHTFVQVVMGAPVSKPLTPPPPRNVGLQTLTVP